MGVLGAVIAFVILVSQGTRRIPVQYAKRVVGRKVYGGTTQYLPIRVNAAGVMPIIFAQSIMFVPATIAQFFPDSDGMQAFGAWFSDISGLGIFSCVLLHLCLLYLFLYGYCCKPERDGRYYEGKAGLFQELGLVSKRASLSIIS